jgi:site-specific DNA recombinase
MPRTSHLMPIDQAATITRTHRAFAYLRVSSESQVNTGYSRDGLSLDSQRDEAQHKATQLDAEIVRVFLDPGKSAFVDLHKRTDFLEMLDELTRCNEHEATRIDYVIVWISSRWARNVRDHFHAHDLVKAAGARLVSITEPMIGEDTPEAFWMEGMAAVNNQYESMKTGRAVKGGLYRKAMAGGSYGGRRMGYIKTIEQLADGRQVGGIAPDPERHAFVTCAFQLYDSGEYSIPQLVDELYRLGLRSVADRRYPSGKVGTSAMQRLLRNPYYAGLIVYKRGTKDEQVFDGRHPALIDRDTFDRVQARLDEKRMAGEFPRVQQHYLRGSVFCGDCGQRLTYGVSTGKNGRGYAYYFCSARINGTKCAQRANMRPELIEHAIQRYYHERPIQLSAKQVLARTEAIEALVSVSQQTVVRVKQAKTDLITKLKAQQVRLIRLHAEEGDDISGDAFRDERLRMQTEIKAAETSLAETEQRLSLDADMLRMALELAEDVAEVYAQADEQTKRGYNQAFFRKLYVMPEYDEDHKPTGVQITSAELTEPYVALLAQDFVRTATNEVDLIRKGATTAESGPYEPLSDAAISIRLKLAEGGGFEPPRRGLPAWRFSRPLHSTALPPFQAASEG